MTLLDILLIVIGIIYLYGGVAKPSFFWERWRTKRARALLGERNAQFWYGITGAIVLVIGILGTMGVF